MDGCVNIITYHTLVDKNGVLVVVTFPGHESDEYVLTESKFTVLSGRTIRDNVALLNLFTHSYDRALVDAGALVGSLVLGKVVFMLLTVRGCNYDLVGGNECYLTVFFCYLTYTGVLRCTILHTGTDDRCFRLDERYGLTLHVGTHESTVRVVVSEERGTDPLR